MIIFNINVRNFYGAERDVFYWQAFSGNNRLILHSLRDTMQLRNCVNQIKTITQHMQDGHFHIYLTKQADSLRKELGEPRYGVE